MLAHVYIGRPWPLNRVPCAAIDEEVPDLEIRKFFTVHPSHHPSPEARGLEDIRFVDRGDPSTPFTGQPPSDPGDRKSTRLNSSHVAISYAVFCLKKKRPD